LSDVSNSIGTPQKPGGNGGTGGGSKPVDGSGPVRKGHPRLFFTAEDIPTIKANAAGDYSKVYEAMKKRIDDLMATGITFPDPLVNSGEHNKNHEIGFRAADAAMVWLISGDKKYLEHAKTILREMIDYYQLRVNNNLNIAWYVYSQICGLCAYDWIYNDLTASERSTFGKDLYKVMYDIAWHGSGVRAARYRENISDHTSGNYGITVLPWYLSLTFTVRA
jgi:heparin/heparan-sulfate lyase